MKTLKTITAAAALVASFNSFAADWDTVCADKSLLCVADKIKSTALMDTEEGTKSPGNLACYEVKTWNPKSPRDSYKVAFIECKVGDSVQMRMRPSVSYSPLFHRSLSDLRKMYAERK